MVSESEGVDLVAPVQRMEGGLNSQILFHDVSLQFSCGTTSQGGGGGGQERRVGGDPEQKTRGLSDFIQEKVYSDEREQFFRNHSTEFRQRNQGWDGERSVSENGSEGDDGDDDDDDEDEDDDEVEGLVAAEDGNKIINNSSGSIHSSEKLCNEKGRNLQKLHSSFGSNRGGGVMVKDGSIVHSANNIRGSSSEQQHQEGRVSSYENSVSNVEHDTYYSQLLQGSEGASFRKVTGGENGCGVSGRKDMSFSKESGDSLRAIFSDPLT